ncbi:aromatic hydrocarbon degradation protein [Flavobacteriaceae bacterium TP-CH-4]|uniref:Aromatic hydrocarbon degradation protein n=1 Tax=Pelagihabitans pacificus TaxID=2696054 RepID=A0A967AR36_9FLAO|nr:outer membrane protein transport protein [Pelagihabitans pacificus]NHF57965.1 aromatic hydrocarbon degradation protein [Pelagihabitans pacificus]
MKRVSIFIFFLSCMFMNGQNISDVLRYSSENVQGTPRFQAMGGAFGALGGDLSALNVNPAGSGIFNHGSFTVTGTYYDRENTSSYFGGFSESGFDDTDLNQIGGVLVFNNSDDTSDWNRLALAFNYDLVQNFDDRVLVRGSSPQGIDNYFSAFAQGLPLGNILLRDGEFIEDAYLDIGASQGFADQQAFLGYYGGILDPEALEDDNTVYSPNAQYSNVNQDFLRSSAGYNGKFTLNLATQYRQAVNLGASLNFHNVLYERFDFYTEDGYDADSEIQRTTFDNYLLTQGSGFSFSFGTIVKLNDIVRVGASYQSPTWYRLTDDLSQRIDSDLADSDIGFINFDIVNLFPRYTLKTPGKLTGSLALVFGKNGLLSVDYGYQDMSEARLRPTDDPNFATVNSDIGSRLAAVSSLRLGGEYRIERFSLRGGYRFEQSPYEDGNTVGDLMGISGGIGYDFGGSRLDLAINRTEQDVNLQLFDVGLPTPANIERVNTNVSLGYTFNF